MNRFRELLGKRWFANAVAGCIVVAVYLLLSRFSAAKQTVSQFFSFFSPVVAGAVFAFLMNPIAKLYDRSIFRRVRKGSARWALSIFLAVITFLLLISLILASLIPQLADSVSRFVSNLSTYAASLQTWLEGVGMNADSMGIDLQNLVDSSENMLDTAVNFISDNLGQVISVSTTAGKGVFNWVIAFILSIYILAAKDNLKRGLRVFLQALFREDRYLAVASFLRRCNYILNRWVIFNLIESLFVGVTTLIFMRIAGMQYAGLVSVIVAVANLWPTFGPIIGAITGGFILVLVKPLHALIFLIFTLILQLCDGYLVKPRLFGTTLGVSSLWILLAVIIGGRMFGVLGILLAIPFAAISDYLYQKAILPALQSRRKRLDSEAAPEPPSADAAPPEPKSTQ